MSESAKAVFLSYASQDVAAALRISTALRATGVEVWLDQEGGLEHGDEWDRKIRVQIKECALFLPVISANTQARKEGYFRIEWELASERAVGIAHGVPFILPILIDHTSQPGALVPDRFRKVQWTKLPAGETPAAFVARVRKLLGGEDAQSGSAVEAPSSEPTQSSELTTKNLELSPAVRLPSESGFETFVPQRSRWRRALPFVSGVIVTALVGGLVAWRLWPTAAPAPVTRFSYRLPDGQTPSGAGRNVIAISPDGRRFVFNTTGGLYLRSLDELEAHVIPGTGANLSNPVFSPDGQSVCYWQDGQLKRIAISGGAAVVICAFADVPFGATSWAPDGTILFGREEILRVPATGGTPTVVIPAQNRNLRGDPQLLPDGDTVLFTEQPTRIASIDAVRIVAQKISTGARKVLVEGGFGARYLATGHLVYVVGNVLMGVAFDARRLAVSGGAVPVVQGVMRSTGSNFLGTANYGVAADGTLVWVYSAAVVDGNAWQLALSDRADKLTPLALRPGPYEASRVSPDGTRIAVGVANPKGAYVAIYDLDGKTTLRRLTFGGNSRYPVWSRDGQRVAFQSDREGDLAIFWQRADGTGPAERLTKPEKDTAHVPASWSPKDETLLFTVVLPSASGLGSIWTYARASGTATRFGNVKDAQQDPMFSPDGRWVAYASRDENSVVAYIQPFPATGDQYQLPSSGGGRGRAVFMGHPFWLPDGTGLIFGSVSPTFSVVTVTTQSTVAFGNPTSVRRFFARTAGQFAPRDYDIMPDGRLIGLIAPQQAADAAGTAPAPPEIRIVEHWTEELKRLVPVK